MSLHLMWFWFRRGSMLWRATRHHWGDTNSQPSVSSHVPITLTLLHYSTHQHTAFALLSQIRLSCNITKQWVINIGVSLSLAFFSLLSMFVSPLSFFVASLCGPSRGEENHTLLGRMHRFILRVTVIPVFLDFMMAHKQQDLYSTYGNM